MDSLSGYSLFVIYSIAFCVVSVLIIGGAILIIRYIIRRKAKNSEQDALQESEK